jgi:hypothetical protein
MFGISLEEIEAVLRKWYYGKDRNNKQNKKHTR